ncbi:MAG: UDP-N-acetylmuramate dehydrogenase [Oscillibacter sp.]|nr:UDP-N-acetylmuramate dehydrogenase [Oscillibacter sp.]
MDWTVKFDERVAAELPDLEVLRDEPMRRRTSFRIGGAARRLALPRSCEQAVLLFHIARECLARPLVIGRGSNLLVTDAPLDRLVVETSRMDRIDLDAPRAVLTAEAGATLARLAEFAAQHALTGLEFAHGIPGSVGGAVFMNAGAYGGEIRQVLTRAVVLFPEEGVKTLANEELDLSYRHSLFSDRPDAVLLRAEFALRAGDETAIRETMRDLMSRRRASQPLEYPSAGSTFKRPEGHYAGALIEASGLKGFRVGDAQVSEKHAGFVVNAGEATFADVTELIRQIQMRVLRDSGVTLTPEVRIIEE